MVTSQSPGIQAFPELQPIATLTTTSVALVDVVNVTGSGILLGIYMEDLDAQADLDYIKLTLDGVATAEIGLNVGVILPDLLLLYLKGTNEILGTSSLPYKNSLRVQVKRTLAGAAGLKTDVLYAVY